MRLLYLDSMDIANLGDGNWGSEAVNELADALRTTQTRLALSTFHFMEAAGVEEDTTRRRFETLFDAGIQPMTFGDDPRDWEIYLAHHFVTGATLPRANGILPILREELPAILEGTRHAHAELRAMQVQGAKAEFLSINAGPRSGEAKDPGRNNLAFLTGV